MSVAVHDGSEVLGGDNEIAERRHGELLAPMIGDVMAQVDLPMTALTQIVVGVGPGPYTSLRIGLVTAHALGLAIGIPVHGICSLDALAADATRVDTMDSDFLVATDARRREVYWAVYASDGRRAGDPAVGTAAEVREQYPDLPVVGVGAHLYPDVLGPGRGPLHPDAAALAELAVTLVPAGQAMPPTPLYLRRPDAVEPAARKSVLR